MVLPSMSFGVKLLGVDSVVETPIDVLGGVILPTFVVADTVCVVTGDAVVSDGAVLPVLSFWPQ